MTRAAVYSRISRDSEDEGKGVERQEQDCRALVTRQGWTVVQIYRDNDISAAGKAKTRPAYDRMIADVRDGKIDYIVAYSNSRLTRRLLELEDLIVLHEQTGVEIHTVVSGNDDLSTADGQMIARIKASVDAGEAARTGERVKRNKLQRATEGKPQGGGRGGRVFGFSKDWQVDDAERAIVQEAFTRRIAGESLHSIATDFGNRGIKTSTGAVMKTTALGHMLRNPLYAGLRRYKGEIIGKSSLEAFVTEAEFNAAQAEIQKNSKGVNTRRHLLTGILICGKCLSPMSGKNPAPAARRGPHYKCAEHYGGCGNVSIAMEQVDWFVVGEARKYARSLKSDTDDTDKAAERDFDAEIKTITDRMKETREAYQNGILTIADASPILAALRNQESALKKEQTQATIDNTDILDMEPFKSGREFEAMNITQKRVYISRFLANVVVAPWNPREPLEWEKRLTFNSVNGESWTRTPARTPEEWALQVAERQAARDRGEWVAP